MKKKITKEQHRQLTEAATKFIACRERLELKDVRSSARQKAVGKEAGQQLMQVAKELGIVAFLFRGNLIMTRRDGVSAILTKDILKLPG